jgi:hypothetical protein
MLESRLPQQEFEVTEIRYIEVALRAAADPEGFRAQDVLADKGQANRLAQASRRLVEQGKLFRLALTHKDVRYFGTEAALQAYQEALKARREAPVLRRSAAKASREKTIHRRSVAQPVPAAPTHLVLGTGYVRVGRDGFRADAEVVVPPTVKHTILPSHPPRFQARASVYAPVVYGHRAVSR